MGQAACVQAEGAEAGGAYPQAVARVDEGCGDGGIPGQCGHEHSGALAVTAGGLAVNGVEAVAKAQIEAVVLIVDGSDIGVDEGVEPSRAHVHACQSACTLQVEMTVAVAYDALYGITEKGVGAVGMIDIGGHAVAAVAVETHASGNPYFTLLVGIDAAYRKVGQSLG